MRWREAIRLQHHDTNAISSGLPGNAWLSLEYAFRAVTFWGRDASRLWPFRFLIVKLRRDLGMSDYPTTRGTVDTHSPAPIGRSPSYALR